LNAEPRFREPATSRSRLNLHTPRIPQTHKKRHPKTPFPRNFQKLWRISATQQRTGHPVVHSTCSVGLQRRSGRGGQENSDTSLLIYTLTRPLSPSLSLCLCLGVGVCVSDSLSPASQSWLHLSRPTSRVTTFRNKRRGGETRESSEGVSWWFSSTAQSRIRAHHKQRLLLRKRCSQ
jgi:hypothetical protein